MVTCLISSDPVEPPPAHQDPEHGAVLTFLGVVRDVEDGRPLLGLRYTCHQALAEKSLRQLSAAALDRFGGHDLYVHHRVGFVPSGETSLLLQVATRHSTEAFALAQHYLAAIKTEIPIWKEPVFSGASQS
ncbi:MAG TPA: molybdenum cofactor biosynthesis protein MoaE [Verrucomicrobiales bacterium]|nr:molybdenum cofactor biosynthesis protein MoaE [Verrucomicrobiales bacterium]